MNTPELIREVMKEAATFFRTMADYSLMEDGQAYITMLEKFSPCADPYIQARAHLQAAANQLDVESELAQVLGVLSTMPEFTLAPKGADKRHHYLRFLGAALDLEKQHGADLRALALRLEAREMLVPKVDTTGWLASKPAAEMLCDYMDGAWSIGTATARLSELCKSGEIESAGVGRKRLVNPKSIAAFTDRQHKLRDKSDDDD